MLDVTVWSGGCGVDHVSRGDWVEWDRVECPQRGLTMGETKFALYLGAVFSTLLRLFTYLFLRVVSLFLSPSLPRSIF